MFGCLVFFIQQVTGHLDDCTCDVETIDAFNNYKLFPRLNELLENDYFRYYKVVFSYKNCIYFVCCCLFFSLLSLEVIADLFKIGYLHFNPDLLRMQSVSGTLLLSGES